MRLSPAALLLADQRTPTGGHAHSGGLEAAILHGLQIGDVPAFLRGRLETVALAEAALAAAAVGAGDHADLDALAVLDAEAWARCPSPALRAASSALGRALLRTAERLAPASLLPAAYRTQSAGTPRPIAFGVTASALGLDPAQAALVSLHDDAAGVASAAVRLLPLDAGRAAGWVAALGPLMERCAAAAATATEPADLPSMAAPLVDARSLVHAERRERLFAT